MRTVGMARRGRHLILTAPLLTAVVAGALVASVAPDGDPSPASTERPVATRPIGTRDRWAGSWQAIGEAPISGRMHNSAIWTGKELVIWGGDAGPERPRPDGTGAGAAYEPATRRWRVLPIAPIATRVNHVVDWTGDEMLIWGGSGEGTDMFDGAGYVPASDGWRVLAPSPFTGPGTSAGAWTDDGWVVIHGFGRADRTKAQVARYDPGADSWHVLGEVDIPVSSTADLLWTDQQLLLAIHPSRGPADWRTSTDGRQWVAIEDESFQGIDAGLALVWTGTEAVVAVTATPDASGQERDQLLFWHPSRMTWRGSRPTSEPFPSLEATWTGSELIMFGRGDRVLAYDPAIDQWLTVAPFDDVERETPTVVWADDRLLVWGGGGPGTGSRRADGIAFVPVRP